MSEKTRRADVTQLIRDKKVGKGNKNNFTQFEGGSVHSHKPRP